MRRSRLLGWGLALFVIAAPASTWAQRPPAERAVELNDEGEKLFGEGRYDEAAARFREGYALEPNPTFLYNLALTYEKSGKYRDALATLERYIEADPDAPDIVAIEARIETLRELVAEREAEAPEPEVVVEVRQEPGLLAGPLPWVVAGTGLAGVVVGAVLGGVAQREHDRAVDEPVHRVALERQDDATALATGATIGLVTGGVVAAVGISLGIAGLTTADGSAVTLRVGPGHLRLNLSF